MIRLLLSLLALILGLVVPGMAEARVYGVCETEIGAAAETAREAPVVAPQAMALITRPGTPGLFHEAPLTPRTTNAPAPATVLIGIDRAHA